jgi:sulfopyruvate decarboxylase subunit beta
MLRVDALQAIYPEVKGQIVVTIMGAVAVELYTLGHRHNFFYLEHAMGLASSMGLGIAVAMPRHKVVVIDGDGSLLMNLGTLVTIGEIAPKNLFHFVFENGTYEANGGHPIPGRDQVDFAGFARSAGWRAVHEFADLNIFEQRIGALLAEPGPLFVDLKVVPSGPQERDYTRLHGPHVRKAFRDALGAS